MIRQLFYQGPSLRDLHTTYAKRGRIDDQAASRATDNIIIDAPVDVVWQVLIDMEKWPTFNPVVSEVRLENGVKVDGRGSFRLNGFPVKFTFAVVAPGRELTWTGSSLWTKAIDRLTLEPFADGKTTLRLEESLAGVLVPLMSSSQRLHEQHEVSLLSFKRAAEAIA